MKFPNLSDEQQRAIVETVKKLDTRPFETKSCTPKWNAQQNLQGRTHYVDDETLRWHKSRVLSSSVEAWGLVFSITTSDAADMHNTRRVYRCVLFDVFGGVIYRPKLEESFSSAKAARNARDRQQIDLVAHYLEAIDNKVRWLERDLENLATVRAAFVALNQPAAA